MYVPAIYDTVGSYPIAYKIGLANIYNGKQHNNANEYTNLVLYLYTPQLSYYAAPTAYDTKVLIAPSSPSHIAIPKMSIKVFPNPAPANITLSFNFPTTMTLITLYKAEQNWQITIGKPIEESYLNSARISV